MSYAEKKGKARERPLVELIKTLKTLRRKEMILDSVEQKFQKLILNEGLFSHTIKDFPYPMTVFRQDEVLVFVNNVLSEETGLYIADLSKSKHNILNRITDSNFEILDAVEDVFMRETTFLNDLSYPLAMFICERSSKRISKKISASKYQSAIFFPIIEDADQITHGAAVFM